MLILLTGGTGQIGRALLPRLLAAGHEVRCLVRPSRRSPHLPAGVPVQLALGRVDDERAVRGALAGVEAVIHLASAEWRGQRGDLVGTDVEGTRLLAASAAAAGVKRLVYVSHLGADRASGYPVLKAKGIGEEFIRQSGVPHLILRSGLVFGPEDRFTNVIALLVKLAPGALLLPSEGRTTLQPIAIQDLVTCLEWGLLNPELTGQTISIGGPDMYTVRELFELVMDGLGRRRALWSISPIVLRGTAWFMEQILPRAPITAHWLDHLAISGVTELTSVTQAFGFKPTPLNRGLEYLKTQSAWREWRRLSSA